MKRTLLFLVLALTAGAAPKSKPDFFFRMGMTGSMPTMTVTTTKVYGCSNFGIYLRQGWSRDTLTFHILGIDSRQRCNNVPDVARETTEIRGIREKHFILRIQNEKRMNYFRVEIDDGTFTITPEVETFIRSVTN